MLEQYANKTINRRTRYMSYSNLLVSNALTWWALWAVMVVVISYLDCRIHSRSYPSKYRYKHYALMQFLPCVFTQVCVNMDKRSFIHLYSTLLIFQGDFLEKIHEFPNQEYTIGSQPKINKDTTCYQSCTHHVINFNFRINLWY